MSEQDDSNNNKWALLITFLVILFSWIIFNQKQSEDPIVRKKVFKAKTLISKTKLIKRKKRD